MGSGDRWQIVVTVNGPGEISGWLYPFATVLKRRAPDIRICVALVPCMFAIGTEASVVETISAVDAVSSTRETMRLIRHGDWPEVVDRHLPGCLLHLGGEYRLSVLLARRLHYPCLAYFDNHMYPAWFRRLFPQSWFSRIFLVEEFSRLKVSPGDHFEVIGNLMVDAARMRCPGRKTERRSPLTIGIFPGSRDYLIKHFLPFYMKVAGLAAPSLSQTRWMVAKADYTPLAVLKQMAAEGEERLFEGESARWEEGEPFGRLISQRGLCFEIQPSEEVMAQADLALTIPGTNTAELAALGVPMILSLPTQYPEIYPIPGLIYYSRRIPLIGKYIRRALSRVHLRRLKYLAHPNRKCQRLVVPELRGKITASQVAATLVETAIGSLEAIERELRSVMGPPGAADRLVEEVLAFWESRLE